LRLRQLVELRVGHGVEEVDEGGERQVSLRLSRSRSQHADRTFPGSAERQFPQSGLADPRLALDQERREPARESVQELADSVELAVAPNHIHERTPTLRGRDRLWSIAQLRPNRQMGSSAWRVDHVDHDRGRLVDAIGLGICGGNDNPE